MAVKKLRILKYYIENPTEKLKTISEKLCVSFNFVQKTISDYHEYQKLNKKLYLVPSLIDYNVYFLFDGFSERRVVVDEGIVQNGDDFTEYELHWIESQKLKNIAVKKLKEQKKSEYFVCTYITANGHESKYIVKAKTKGEAQTKFNLRVRSRKKLVDITNYPQRIL